MEALFDSSLTFIRWLQENYPELGGLMSFVSTLGIFEFYLAVIPLVYWTIHKEFGKHLAYLMTLGMFVNSVFKELFRGPRPYWLDSSLGIGDDIEFGIPSGHAQLSSTAYLLAAIWIRKGWVWGVAIACALLMGFSRLFLGVHFWHDVVAGYILSLLLLALYLVYRRYFRSRIRNRIMGQRLLIVLAIPLVLGILYLLARLIVGAVDATVAWAEFISEAQTTAFEDVVTATGMMVGLGIGFILEASRTNFTVDGAFWKRVVRYLVGIVLLVGIWYGSGQLFPDEPFIIAFPLRFIRYTFLGLLMSYWAPALFVRMGLAEAGPGPEVSLSVSSDGLMKG